TEPAEMALVPPTTSAFSSRTTSRPRSAPASAAVMPAAPAPITTRSTSPLSSASPGTRALDDRAGRDGMRHPALDMRDQDRARGARVAGQRAIEQGVMLIGGDRAAIAEREHLIADIAVEHGRVG